MELLAILEGLKKLSELNIDCVTVYSDSQYAINGISSWVYSWLRDDPKLEYRRNGKIWLELVKKKKEFKNIRFQWVKGHSGHKWNELCDSLCEEQYSRRGLPGQEYFNFRHKMKGR